MSTIADNIRSMAVLVAEVKKTTHLSEATILRIVDMNFALAQGMNNQTFSGNEDFPIPDMPDDLSDGNPLALFPSTDEDIEDAEDGEDEDALATTIKPN